MRISWRSIVRSLPMFLPLVCAVTLMILSGTLRRAFVDVKKGHCCTAADVKFPTDFADSMPPNASRLPIPPYAARVHYVAAAQVHSVALLSGLAISVALLVPQIRHRNSTARTALVLGILAFGVASTGATVRPETSRAFHNLLQLTVVNEFHDIETWRIRFEQATSIVATLFVCIIVLLLAPVTGDVKTRLTAAADNHRRLSYVLAVATIVLGSDVLLRTSLGLWSSKYFEKTAHAEVTDLVESIAAGWAVYNTLFLAVVFIPAALVLRHRIRTAAEEIDPKAPPAWFDATWLAASPLQDISRIIAILTPLLIGKASDILDLLK